MAARLSTLSTPLHSVPEPSAAQAAAAIYGTATTASPWAQEQGLVEVFEVKQRALEAFLNVALCKRSANQALCCFSNPLTGLLGSAFPCVAGPCTEIFCAYPEFKRRVTSRHVAITDKCVTIKTPRPQDDAQQGPGFNHGALRRALRRPYKRAPTATVHNTNCCCGRGVFALDQFGVDSEFECKEEAHSAFMTRRLYFDQIRSAEIIQDGRYRTSCGPFCCCGFSHSSPSIAFVRIDIGREDEAIDAQDLGQTNPVLIGLKDPAAFCHAVNIRARGGGVAAAMARGDGETKVVDIVDVPASAVMTRDGMAVAHAEVGGIASAAGVGMVPPLPSEPESTLSTELANLAQLFASGALSSVEFANAKDACIKTYST